MGSKPHHVKLRETRNRPPNGEPWVWLTRELLESDAWRSMSRAARLVVDRVLIEHMAHAGTANGDLIVTYADFVKFGVRRESLPAAIADAGARGLIIITEKGRASTGPDRWPSKYAVGWLPLKDGAAAPNRWKVGSPRSPIPGNIESSTGTGTREKGGKPRALVPKTPLAPSTGNGTGGSRKAPFPSGESGTRENECDARQPSHGARARCVLRAA